MKRWIGTAAGLGLLAFGYTQTPSASHHPPTDPPASIAPAADACVDRPPRPDREW